MSVAAMPHTATPQAAPSHPYTCNTCQVAFKGSELQRSHMQTDWHRYNLKRRVAALPPLTSEVFAEKVLANQASAAATAAKASYEKICALCQRTYFSQNAYQNHLGSQKHKARLAQWENGHGTSAEDDASSMMSSAFSLGEPIDTKTPVDDPAAEAEFSKVIDGIRNTSISEDDPVTRRPTRPHHSAGLQERSEHPLSASPDGDTTPLPTPTTTSSDETARLGVCLFCNLRSDSLESNLAHMESVHSMFIPERNYLVDMDGLIQHLHDRVHILHECLYCGQVRQSTMGAKTHMRDKGHTMIAFETEAEMLEVGDFYDFRSTYSDGEDEEMHEDRDESAAATEGGVKLGARRAAQYAGAEGEDGADEDGWESDDTMSDADGLATPTRLPRPPVQAYIDDYELRLPSGRTAGHRSLARFYRQNLHSYPTPEERASRPALTNGEAQQNDDESRRSRQVVTRANGGQGMVGVAESAKKQARAVEMQSQRREQRQQSRYQWGNERRANAQKHYRDPLLQ